MADNEMSKLRRPSERIDELMQEGISRTDALIRYLDEEYEDTVRAWRAQY